MVSAEDLMIAAIVQRNDAVLATRNTKDFACLGMGFADPFAYDGLARTCE